jgi:hypothetical protein
MNAATASRPATTLATFLAGLQAGMIAVCWMLAWLGSERHVAAAQLLTAENLMASVLHGKAQSAAASAPVRFPAWPYTSFCTVCWERIRTGRPQPADRS